MVNNSKIQVSEKGYKQYLEALEQLKNTKKELLAERGSLERTSLPSGGQGGDYTMSSNDQELDRVNCAINLLEEEISRLVVVSSENSSESEVCIGDIVTLLQVDVDEVSQYKLTGGMMPNMSAKIPEITIRSPLGKAILGKNVGDSVSYFVNDRSGQRRDFTVQIISKENGLEKQESQPE